jgi:putative addiction module killer protein
MYEVRMSQQFERWYRKLDFTEQNILDSRVLKIKMCGHFGVHKRIGNIWELKFRNGLRIYYAIENSKLLLLLIGGKKDSQKRDIILAREIYKRFHYGK